MENRKYKPTKKDMLIALALILVSFFGLLVGIKFIGEVVVSDTQSYAQPTVFGDIDNKVKTEPYCFNPEFCLDERYYFVISDEYYPVTLINYNKFEIGQIVALHGSSSVTKIELISEGDDGPIE